MDCNKDDAIRAREVAERKLAAQDYDGALKFLQKARRLFPAMENMTQLLTVVEVHVAAQRKINGTEMDWYGILQVDSKSEEVIIKKQYRKLALLLHPDKNKCAGAESAFKLVGEASQVLLDKQQRFIHDMKSNQVAGDTKTQRSQSSQHSSMHSYVPAQQLSFTTVCPSCKVPFQIQKSYVNAQVNCPFCRQPFQAREVIFAQNNCSYGRHSWDPSHPQQYPEFTQNPFQAFASQANNGSSTNKFSVPTTQFSEVSNASEKVHSMQKQKENAEAQVVHMKERKQRKKAKADEASRKQKEKAEKVEKSKADAAARKQKEKEQAAAKHPVTKRKSVGSYDDDNDDLRQTLEDLQHEHQGIESVKDGIQHRSSRPKRNVNYAMDMREKQEEEEIEEEEEEEAEEEKEEAKFIVPDSDFYEFDKDREPKNVAAGQIWAAYDHKDGMPRYYFEVKKIMSLDPFKVRIRWLELQNLSIQQAQIKKLGFCLTCGTSFRLSQSQSMDGVDSFSHIVTWKRGPISGVIHILPNAGDVWAFFPEWQSRPVFLKSKVILYQPVEILTDFDEKSGVTVVCLEKVNGFKSVFKRSKTVLDLTLSELHQFSHRIPARVLKGNEAPSVPLYGCLELDPAALPTGLGYA